MRVSPPLRIAAAVAALSLLSGCSYAQSLDTKSEAAAHTTERQHQDAQVYSAVVRDDLQSIQSLGLACSSPATRIHCVENATKTGPHVQQALADVEILTIPPFMVTDNNNLVTALHRVEKAIPAVLTATDRIKAAYADNEFDVALKTLNTSLGRISQDGH